MLSKNNICGLVIILASFCLIGTNARGREQAVEARNKEQLKVIMAHLLETIYVSPGIGKQLGSQLRARFESGAYKDVATPTQLAEALTRDLRELSKDGHLYVRYDPATRESETILTPQEWERRRPFMFPSVRGESSTPSDPPPAGGPELNARMASQLQQANYHFREAKYLSGNIGYLNWFAPGQAARDTAAKTMALLANSDQLIIDLSALHDVERRWNTPDPVTSESLTPTPTQPQAASPNRNAPDDAVLAKELNAYLEQATASDAFSGAVLIARNGEPVFKKAYGMANKTNSIANHVDTKFDLGSMNKMFTAVAIAQLAERGKLSFTDTVGKLLPDYPNKAVAEKVTVHQLLTHTSGMGSYFNEKFQANLNNMKTVADYLPLFVNDPLAFEPGTKWQYSNSGFTVLGLIIEKVSGQSYYDYVKEHIFRPAGMVNTDSYERDKEIPNLAIGYMKMGDNGRLDPSASRRANTPVRPAKGSPAGGGYSTVEDMLRFSVALRDHKLLSQKYTEIVTTGKVETGVTGRKYAYGFGDDVWNGRHIVGHNGGGPGIGANFDMLPELGYTVVVLGNYDPPAMMPVVMKIRELLPIATPSTTPAPSQQQKPGSLTTETRRTQRLHTSLDRR